MKKLLPALLISCFFVSCSNDLDIIADYEEVTIVYGLLNPSDNTHYVQVFKGFLEPNTSALILAQDPNALYYDDSVEVKIERGGQSILLEKIDAALIGLPKTEGIFVDSPNYVYRFSENLNQTQTYTLTFLNQRTGHTVKAQTPIVRDFDILFPQPGFQLNMNALNTIDFNWRSAPGGKIYQLIFRFHYLEWNVNSPSQVDTLSVDWLLSNNLTSNTTNGGESMVFRFDPKQFYNFLPTRLTANSELRRKTADDPVEVVFYVGAEELFNYINVSNAQTGITSLQVKPEYTNVENGLGIFSSRYLKSRSGVKFNPRTLDSLSCGSLTKNLNFVDTICE